MLGNWRPCNFDAELWKRSLLNNQPLQAYADTKFLSTMGSLYSDPIYLYTQGRRQDLSLVGGHFREWPMKESRARAPDARKF